MTTLRRFVVFQVLLLWQGGFLFYASFVVPVGTHVLGSAEAQGAITAHVTDTLNIVGVVGLAVMAWDLNYTRDRSSRRTEVRWWCWVIVLFCQGLLIYAHLLLDSDMDQARMHVVARKTFRIVHKVYLWTSTVQWVACLVFVLLTLLAWRSEDRNETRSTPTPNTA